MRGRPVLPARFRLVCGRLPSGSALGLVAVVASCCRLQVAPAKPEDAMVNTPAAKRLKVVEGGDEIDGKDDDGMDVNGGSMSGRDHDGAALGQARPAHSRGAG